MKIYSYLGSINRFCIRARRVKIAAETILEAYWKTNQFNGAPPVKVYSAEKKFDRKKCAYTHSRSPQALNARFSFKSYAHLTQISCGYYKLTPAFITTEFSLSMTLLSVSLVRQFLIIISSLLLACFAFSYYFGSCRRLKLFINWMTSALPNGRAQSDNISSRSQSFPRRRPKWIINELQLIALFTAPIELRRRANIIHLDQDRRNRVRPPDTSECNFSASPHCSHSFISPRRGCIYIGNVK